MTILNVRAMPGAIGFVEMSPCKAPLPQTSQVSDGSVCVCVRVVVYSNTIQLWGGYD